MSVKKYLRQQGTMNVPFVDINRQYVRIKRDLHKTLQATLNSSHFILGRELEKLEREFASYCQSRYAVGVGNGTEALHLALRANGIGAGDEVITAANTFIATVLAIIYTGAKPVLVDIDPKQYTMDPGLVKKMITKKTKAIVPVHLYGQPAEMGPLVKTARRYNIKVIEDACQAHGAAYKGRRTGHLGDTGCFSFYPTKNLGAYGDGGMVVTDNATVAQKIRLLRNYGSSRKYYHEYVGFNSRLDTIQAAILRLKLKKLDRWNTSRRNTALLYNKLLQNTEVITPKEHEHAYHVYHLYVIRVAVRDRLVKYLTSQGISIIIHYPIPVHLQKACRSLGYKRGDFPVTEKLADNILSLPMFPEITKKEVSYVAEKIKDFYCS